MKYIPSHWKCTRGETWVVMAEEIVFSSDILRGFGTLNNL